MNDPRRPARQTRAALAAMLLLLLAAPHAAAQGARAGGWVRVEPAGKDFSVLMPSQPQVETDEVPIMGGKYRTRMYTSIDDDHDAAVYLAVTQELPTLAAALRPAEKLDEFIDGFREGFAGPLGAATGAKVELTFRQDLELKGRRGRLYAVAIAETPGLLQVYDGGRRVFLLFVLGARDGHARAARFFNSFDLKGAAPAPPPALRTSAPATGVEWASALQ